MGAIICIIALVLLVLFVLGRGAGRTVADVEHASKSAVSHTTAAVPAAAARGVEISARSAHKTVELSKATAAKGKAAVHVGGLVTRSVAKQTHSVVKNGFQQFRDNYHETKEAKS